MECALVGGERLLFCCGEEESSRVSGADWGHLRDRLAVCAGHTAFAWPLEGCASSLYGQFRCAARLAETEAGQRGARQIGSV